MVALLLILLVIGFILVSAGSALDNAVYKHIDNHSATKKQAQNRKATYNTVGHLLVRLIMKK